MNAALRAVFLLTITGVFTSAPAPAAMSTWTDLQGNSFKGEPRGIYGPFALFKTGAAKGRRLLLRTLSPEDCVRFHQETAGSGKRARAADWSTATSETSTNLRSRLLRLADGHLVKADLRGLPEPELYVCFFGSGWEGISYEMASWYRATYARLRRLYGNDMETVFLGVRHDSNEGFATSTRMPWLTVEYGGRAHIDAYKDFAPEEGAGMVLLTREGIPLALTKVEDIQGMKQFIDTLCSTMAAADPKNSLFWHDRAYYLAQIRPVQFADRSAPALLVGNPLRASILRKSNIERLTAKLEVDAKGHVTSAVITNRDAMKPALVAALEKALQSNFVFVPAIDHGQPVASSYDFEYIVPDEKTDQEADRDWLLLNGRREISIPAWLLLRPIRVPEEEFSEVQHVDAEGRAVMAPVQVETEAVTRRAQLNAFNSDFFGEGGAASVRPSPEEAVLVEAKPLHWERYESKDGFVEMSKPEGADYCVGYAWAEFEAGNGGPAYLGLGSDDGVKIWLNGALVHDRWVQRPTQIDEDLIRLQLNPGKNTILVKIQNRQKHWSFFFRLRH